MGSILLAHNIVHKLLYSVFCYKFNNYLHNCIAYYTSSLIPSSLNLCFLNHLKIYVLSMIFHPPIFVFELLNNYLIKFNISIYSFYLYVILRNVGYLTYYLFVFNIFNNIYS